MSFMLFTIVLRVFTTHILVKKLGINNQLTNLILFDAKDLINEYTDTNEIYTDWAAIYPFDQTEIEVDLPEIESPTIKEINIDNKYTRTVSYTQDRINSYTTDYLFGHTYMAIIAGKYNQLIQWKLPSNPQDIDRIIEMNNGYLAYIQEEINSEDINTIVNSITEFNSYLSENNIPLLVVNCGSKVCPEDTQLTYFDKQFEYTNENGDALLNGLNANHINTLDIREEILKSELDWYSCYYITDHHPTPSTSLFSANRIANKLNEISDANFSPLLFDESSYEFVTYEKIMFGGQGRAVTFSDASLEDYTSVLPLFETNLVYDVIGKDYHYEGPYNQALINIDILTECSNYSETDYLTQLDAHTAINIHNYPLSIVKNLNPPCNQDFKILIIQDSFSWYTTSFLSLGVSEIDIIYPYGFTGSIRNYIEQTSPDIVIIAFCERSIYPIDYSSHTSFFDFR